MSARHDRRVTRRGVLLASASVAAGALGVAACNEDFVTGPRDNTVTLELAGWADTVVLGDVRTLRVRVRDARGEEIVGVATQVDIAAGPGAAGGSDPVLDARLNADGASAARLAVTSATDSVAVAGARAGTATAVVTLLDPRFRTTEVRRTATVVVAGVRGMTAPDTTLTALGDTSVAVAAALARQGAGSAADYLPVPAQGVTWTRRGPGAVRLVGTGDTVRVVAQGAGADTLVATHAYCLAGAHCADTTVVRVAQGGALAVGARTFRAWSLGDSVTAPVVLQDARGNAIAGARVDLVPLTAADSAIVDVNTAANVPPAAGPRFARAAAAPAALGAPVRAPVRSPVRSPLVLVVTGAPRAAASLAAAPLAMPPLVAKQNGTARVAVRALGPTGALLASDTVAVIVRQVAHAVQVAPAFADLTPGDSIPVQVRAVDARGRLIADATFQPAIAGATYRNGRIVVPATAAAGTATLQALVTGAAAPANNPGAPFRDPEPDTARVLVRVPPPMAAGDTTATDANTLGTTVRGPDGRPLRNTWVRFRIPAGTLQGPDSVQSDANGAVVLRWTLPTQAGTYTATAVLLDGPTSADTAGHIVLRRTAVVTAGAPARLALVEPPPAAAALDAALTPAPAVRLEDRYGNPVRVAGIGVTATAPDAAPGFVLGGALSAPTDSNGVARFPGLVGTGAPATVALRMAGTAGGTTPLVPVTTAPIAFATVDTPVPPVTPGPVPPDPVPPVTPSPVPPDPVPPVIPGPVPPVTSAPAPQPDTYTTPAGTPLTLTAAGTPAGLLANDQLGTPSAAITAFGAGSLGGAVTDHAAGATATVGNGGSLTINADGSAAFTPAAGFSGDFTFQYRVANSAGTADATVTIAVSPPAVVPQPPTAANDTYTTAAGTPLTITAAGTPAGLLGNDQLGTPGATVARFAVGTLGGPGTGSAAGSAVTDGHGGTLQVNADGGLTYTPSDGYTGGVSFQYEIGNAAGTSIATASIAITQAPTAQPDTYTAADGTLTVTAAGTPAGLLANDQRGAPAGVVASFGGGSLGGAVTDHAAGTTAAIGNGGSLTVNADGSVAFTGPGGFSGSVTFQYRLANATGSSDQLVTITVPAPAAPAAPPTAVADGPPVASTPGQPFHAALNTPLVVGSGATPSLVANDQLGSPAATIGSFGGGSLGGAVTDHAAGTTAAAGNRGSLTVNADGTATFTPNPNFTGELTFEYRLANGAGTTDATVTIAVGARPGAVSDTYAPTLVGNVPVNTATSTHFRVTDNDAGDAKVLAITGQSNGTAALDADGTFTFRPDRGFEGPASFTYTVSNGFGTSAPATVSMTVAAPIWFVNAAAGADGDGQLGAPFNSLASLAAVNNGTGSNPGAADRIFLYTGSYTGPLTLLRAQRLIGQGTTASLSAAAGVSWPADAGPEPATNGVAPTLGASNATALTLASVAGAATANNTLRGFDIGSVGATGTALAGTNFGLLTVAEVGITTDGRALNLTNGTLGGSFSALSSTGGSYNVMLAAVSTGGANRALGGASDVLSGATINALRIDGGNGSFTYAGTVANSALGAVGIFNKTGGAVTVSGPINPAAAARGIHVANNSATLIDFTGSVQKISTGNGVGVHLSGNDGSTIRFTGGALEVASTIADAVNVNAGSAASGGTLIVTGAHNTITSAGGVALSVANTTIGTGGLTFRSISATGGTSGIVLSNTGSTAGLTVTGDGATAGSGGTIQNTSGDGVRLAATSNTSLSWMNFSAIAGGVTNFAACNANLASGCESAVDLDNATGVTLDRLNINGAGQAGVSAYNSSGLTVTNSQVLNVGDADGESGILLHNLAGTSLIQDVTVDNPEEFGIKLFNTAGTAGLTLRRVTVRNNLGTYGEAGFQAEVSGGTTTVLVDDSDFLNTDGTGVFGTSSSAGALNLTVQNSVFANNQALPSGINFTTGGSSSGRLTATGNTINGCAGAPTTCSQGIDLDASVSSRLDATVLNNTIANAGMGTGIEFISNENSVGRGRFEGNNVTVAADKIGFNFQARSVGTTQTGSLDLTLKGNTISGVSSSAAAYGGMTFQVGSSGSLVHNNSMCVNLATAEGAGGNVVNGTNNPPLLFAYTVRQRPSTVFKLQGYVGAPNVPTALEAFITQNNLGGTMGGSAEVYDATASTAVNYTGGTCAAPSATPAP